MRKINVAEKNFIIPVLLFLLVVSSFSIYGCEPNRQVVSLRGNWKFSIGDSKKFATAEFDDEEWENVYVPSSWEDEGFRFYNGYAWYRKHFDLNKDELTGALYLYLGPIDDVDEVYVNGHYIGGMGGFPPDYYTAYNVHRTYVLPAEYLRPGENVLAVRIYDEGGEGGILGRNVGVYNYGDYSSSTFALMGNWKFHLFDDEKWSETGYDDSDWEDIVVPSSWEDQGFRDYDGFAWYRKAFQLPSDFPTDDMVLLAGVIDDMDEVFVNGVRVGGTGNIDSQWAENNEWNRQRIYYLPGDLLKPGKKNIIAVRVFDQEVRGGIYEGPVAILPRSEYKNFWRQYNSERNDFRRYFGDRTYSSINFGPFHFSFED